ncbi:hypothetical protein A2U01_0106183, partial [Trifolium medium]|nr:hypothetical protein [Trifolium medium]
SAGKYFLKNSALNISQVITILPTPNLSLAFFHHWLLLHAAHRFPRLSCAPRYISLLQI